MTRTTPILHAALMFCLLPSLPVHSREPDSHRGVRGSVREAETDVKVRELELKVAELGLDEATVEFGKIKLLVDAATQDGDSRKVGYLKLDLKQAAIRVEMRKVQSDMLRLQFEAQARAALEHGSEALNETPEKPRQVRLDRVEDSGVVVIRGKKGDVNETRALFEGEMIQSKSVPSILETRVFTIANGNVHELASVINELFPDDDKDPMYVAVDSRTNSVVARGIASDLGVVEAILLRLDRD